MKGGYYQYLLNDGGMGRLHLPCLTQRQKPVATTGQQ